MHGLNQIGTLDALIEGTNAALHNKRCSIPFSSTRSLFSWTRQRRCSTRRLPRALAERHWREQGRRLPQRFD
jgi:hypothetical protein